MRDLIFIGHIHEDSSLGGARGGGAMALACYLLVVGGHDVDVRQCRRRTCLLMVGLGATLSRGGALALVVRAYVLARFVWVQPTLSSAPVRAGRR